MEDKKTNDDEHAAFNKRQFWPYQRLTGKKTRKLRNAQLGGKGGKGDTHKKTKIFHVINNKVVVDKDLRERLDSIYIPPGYKDLVVAKSSNNKIQAIGTDTKGRRQYIYNSKYTKKRNDRKYDSIMGLAKKINQIETDNENAINTLVSKPYATWKLPDDYIPIIIHMLRTYHFRIGNEKYLIENDSYGITTLKKEHIKFHPKGGKFTIEFIGKKGVLNSFTDDNRKMNKILQELIKHSGDGFLFKYKNTNDNSDNKGQMQLITPEHIHNYFVSKYNEDISPKMFRTWYANLHLLDHLQKLYKEDKLKYRMTKQEINNVVNEIGEYVSSKLNNTPSVSKVSYIDNRILKYVMRNPYRFAEKIPENKEEKNKFLLKLIKELRM